MKVTINGIHFAIDSELDKYVHKKIGGLDKYLPRTARESASAEVKIKEVKNKGQKPQQSCEVILYLPKDSIVVKETTLNAYAAIDIIEHALRAHINRYKHRHASGKLYHRLRLRLGRV